MDDTANSKTGLLNELLANNSRYAKTFDKPMSLGVKRKVCGGLLQRARTYGQLNLGPRLASRTVA